MSFHLLFFVVQTAHTVSFPIVFYSIAVIETAFAQATPSRPNIAAASLERPGQQTSALRRGRAL